MPSAPLAVRRVSLDALHLDPANARSHGPENLEAIKGSLARFGQAEPLVIHRGTGRVIAGNGRLVAMRELGWTECDVVELDISDLDATALGIALNRTAELAGWHEDVLAKLLDELRAEGALDGVGFSTEDIDELLAELAGDEPLELEDPGPDEPPEAPVARTGDAWILGEHRLLCGDATRLVDVQRVMDGEKAALVATDPPFLVDYTGERPNDSGKDWTATYHEVDIKDADGCSHGREGLPRAAQHGVLPGRRLPATDGDVHVRRLNSQFVRPVRLSLVSRLSQARPPSAGGSGGGALVGPGGDDARPAFAPVMHPP